MKELMNIGNGALVASEQSGQFTLAFNASGVLGGGEASGVLSASGQGQIVISAKQAFDLAIKLLEAHSPKAFVALEEGVKGIVDNVISGS